MAVTGVQKAGFAQILYAGQVRWVRAKYLSDKKPAASAAAGGGGITSAPCPDGSGTESGLSSRAVTLYRSACAAFPALSSYGGYAPRGEHGGGNAIDFMVTDPALGQALADWARAHASELGVYDVIWSQRIWTPTRGGEGWRAMSDRGSATANHFDHVHIMVSCAGQRSSQVPSKSRLPAVIANRVEVSVLARSATASMAATKSSDSSSATYCSAATTQGCDVGHIASCA